MRGYGRDAVAGTRHDGQYLMTACLEHRREGLAQNAVVITQDKSHLPPSPPSGQAPLLSAAGYRGTLAVHPPCSCIHRSFPAPPASASAPASVHTRLFCASACPPTVAARLSSTSPSLSDREGSELGRPLSLNYLNNRPFPAKRGTRVHQALICPPHDLPLHISQGNQYDYLYFRSTAKKKEHRYGRPLRGRVRSRPSRRRTGRGGSHHGPFGSILGSAHQLWLLARCLGGGRPAAQRHFLDEPGQHEDDHRRGQRPDEDVLDGVRDRGEDVVPDQRGQ